MGVDGASYGKDNLAPFPIRKQVTVLIPVFKPVSILIEQPRFQQVVYWIWALLQVPKKCLRLFRRVTEQKGINRLIRDTPTSKVIPLVIGHRVVIELEGIFDDGTDTPSLVELCIEPCHIFG
jgi:hypothetical protein